MHEMHIQKRGKGGELDSRGEAAAQSASNLRPATVVLKHQQLPAAANSDETYDISVEAADDVFARFDWTLSELAK